MVQINWSWVAVSIGILCNVVLIVFVSHAYTLHQVSNLGPVSLEPRWLGFQNTVFSRLIYANQHPSSCVDRKFVVFRLPKKIASRSRGIGAIANSLWRWVVLAMLSNRTLVVDSIDWDMSECASTTNVSEGGMLCYFQRHSSCSMADVYNLQPNVSRHVELDLQWTRMANLGNESVLVTAPAFSPLSPTKWIAFGNISFNMHSCALPVEIYGIFFAPNQPMQRAITTNFFASLPLNFNSSRTIGIPLRGSDKCIGHKSGLGEMKCLSFEGYINISEQLAASYPEIDSILITSEDPKIIEQAKNFSRFSNNHWRFIFNDNDVMQGTGSNVDIPKRLGSGGLSSVMVSTFTSMHLHLKARFLIAHGLSNVVLVTGLVHASCDSCCPVSNQHRIQKWVEQSPMCNLHEKETTRATFQTSTQ